MKTFFTVRQTTVSARPWSALPNMWPLFVQLSTRLVAGRNELIGMWAAVGLVGVMVWRLKDRTFGFVNGRAGKAYVMIIIWIGVGLVGLGVYKQHIYDHYFGFLFPAPFLLMAGVFQELVSKHRIRGWWVVGTVVVLLSYYDFLESPLKYPPGRQLQRSAEVARKIEKESGEAKFNLAVIAERNYEDAYQYFLEKWGTNVVDIDPLRYEETVGEKLFVVCELPAEKCDPTHNSKAEVANFGWSEVTRQWIVQGISVYELVHTKQVENEEEAI